MIALRWSQNDVVGLVHPALDAHTLGLSSVARLLRDCGIRSEIAKGDICTAIQQPETRAARLRFKDWVTRNGISQLGASFRLEPTEAVRWFDALFYLLTLENLLVEAGGPIKGLFFGGLPEASERVRQKFGGRVRVFKGAETVAETLEVLGIPEHCIPKSLQIEDSYEKERLRFGESYVRSGAYRAVRPPSWSYEGFGTRQDSLLARLSARARTGGPPLMRAHVGPYNPVQREGVDQFIGWCRELSRTGLLDILSIGTSQLTQERFEGDWNERPNGGGVPLRTEAEYHEVYEASRPMLVRTYAGTQDVPRLAEVHERSLNIAWHALSLWWFSQIDGRGPLGVLENLEEHFGALDFIQRSGKPFEANVPHHFAFRGADDVTYVVSAVLAARVAKARGVRTFVFQNMLNTPKGTSGITDLAKSRAILRILRGEESSKFRVLFQPRAGLSYFSPSAERAKAQLAAATALMDDVEPNDHLSPAVIHVVSYSEGFQLATPDVVDESIQITRGALEAYREEKRRGRMGGPPPEATEKALELEREARTVLSAIESSVPHLYSPKGLYEVFAAGFLPVPDLWECREEFAHATKWRSQTERGSTRYVHDDGTPVELVERLAIASENVARRGKGD